MTLLEPTPEIVRERSLPVLETARLVLRAPSLADAETLATLVNDRRIAEMTTRIPYPTRSRIRRRSSPGSTAATARPSTWSPRATAPSSAPAGSRGGPDNSPSSAIGWACPIGATATPPKPRAP